MRPTRLWFIRHGEVEPPYVGTFVGRLDVGLSPVGQHQAAAVAAYLADAELDALLASPRKRAIDTARPLAQGRGDTIEARACFAEMDFGDWEGLAWPDIAARDPHYAKTWQGDPEANACPGGESAGAFCQRVQAGLADLLEEFQGRTVALFGHAGVNRAVLAQVLRRPYMEAFTFAQDYGCLNAASWDPPTGFAQIALVNAVPGPRSRDQGDGRAGNR